MGAYKVLEFKHGILSVFLAWMISCGETNFADRSVSPGTSDVTVEKVEDKTRKKPEEDDKEQPTTLDDGPLNTDTIVDTGNQPTDTVTDQNNASYALGWGGLVIQSPHQINPKI